MNKNLIDNLSLLLQALSLELLFRDFNNSDLMQELQKIIKQNEEILNILKER